MPLPALLVVASASDCGKSVIVAGLCRWFANAGFTVAPFKAQNMSNNAAVIAEGIEIGRAQALQAQAARIPAQAAMNPILLKPLASGESEVVILGRASSKLAAANFSTIKQKYFSIALASYRELAEKFQICICEGAGGAAEVNLRSLDIANFGLARAAQIPVLLMVDVERGGAIAALTGTWDLLSADERNLVCGFLVNKFRGVTRLFEPAVAMLEQRLGIPCWGVIPWLDALKHLPAEDSLALSSPPQRLAPKTSNSENQKTGTAALVNNAKKPGQSEGLTTGTTVQLTKVRILQLASISNFDEFTQLTNDAAIDCEYLPMQANLPADLDWLILPGSRSVLADLDKIRTSGFEHEIRVHLRRGGKILAICGGCCLLAEKISDLDGFDGASGEQHGLALLPITIKLEREKKLTRTMVAWQLPPTSGDKVADHATHLQQSSTRALNFVAAYEMRRARSQTNTAGQINRASNSRLASWLVDKDGVRHGYLDSNRQIYGCFFHGLLQDARMRHQLLSGANIPALEYPDVANNGVQVDSVLDQLAQHLDQHLTQRAKDFLLAGQP